MHMIQAEHQNFVLDNPCDISPPFRHNSHTIIEMLHILGSKQLLCMRLIYTYYQN